MKCSRVETRRKVFEPITIKLTIESREELDSLEAQLRCSATEHEDELWSLLDEIQGDLDS